MLLLFLPWNKGIVLMKSMLELKEDGGSVLKENQRVYYFDHAASSWPKPPLVSAAMIECMEQCGANPGRGSHRMAIQASRVLYEGRERLAKLFGVKNANDIAYTLNATHALNLAIKGHVKEGDHVICTSVEHNSVRRPLESLRETKGISITYLKADEQGNVDLMELQQSFQRNTSLVVSTHSSNLLGTILPVGEIGDLCRKRGSKLLVDAAQTAGTLSIDVETMGIDLLAFPGHKGLLGPQGTGGLYIHPNIQLEPILHGGTGSRSEDIQQPDVRPDRYEAGTPNTVGIAGLKEGVKAVLDEGVSSIHQRELKLICLFMEETENLPGIRFIGPPKEGERTGLASFVMDRMDSSELAHVLDRNYGIAVRSGFHCTPLAHQCAGTLETGAVRVSVGYSTTEEEVRYFVEAMKEISMFLEQGK